MKQGRAVMSSCGLKESECAVINKPSYWDHVKLKTNEVVYAHANASSQLYAKFNHLNDSHAKLKIVTP